MIYFKLIYLEFLIIKIYYKIKIFKILNVNISFHKYFLDVNLHLFKY